MVFYANGTDTTTGPYVEVDDFRLAQMQYLNSVMESQMYY